jgi:hypothetical protein
LDDGGVVSRPSAPQPATRSPPEQSDMTIQEVYAALVDDRVRNELILTDLIRASGDGRSPLLLTGRTEHLKYFESKLAGRVNNVFILKGGMGKKQRRSTAEAIAAVPECEPRIIPGVRILRG